MIWGIVSGSIQQDILEPLGLVCYGGGSFKNGDMSYHVTSINNLRKIDIYLTEKEFNDIKNYMKKYNKKIRLKKLKEIKKISK